MGKTFHDVDFVENFSIVNDVRRGQSVCLFTNNFHRVILERIDVDNKTNDATPTRSNFTADVVFL